jgi:hypothetical protein
MTFSTILKIIILFRISKSLYLSYKRFHQQKNNSNTPISTSQVKGGKL